MTEKRTIIAEQLKRLLIESSPVIEEYAAAICSGCTDVCCRQKHGTFRDNDILYLRALGIDVPPRDQGRPPEGPCELMGPLGCVQPRWLRPFKCTWYFCGPLLKALSESPPRKTRRVSAMLQEMADLYDELAKE
jgi:hypothetical protein